MRAERCCAADEPSSSLIRDAVIVHGASSHDVRLVSHRMCMQSAYAAAHASAHMHQALDESNSELRGLVIISGADSHSNMTRGGSENTFPAQGRRL